MNWQLPCTIWKKNPQRNKSIFSIFGHTTSGMTAIRKKLIEEINSASESAVKELYKLHVLVKSETNDTLNWRALTDDQKDTIETGLKQLHAGKGIPAKKAMAQLTKKYGLS